MPTRTDFTAASPLVSCPISMSGSLEICEAAADSIRAMLPATEAQILWNAPRHFRHVLGAMVGKRSGAETTGEVVIVGYRGGHEVFGLRQ